MMGSMESDVEDSRMEGGFMNEQKVGSVLEVGRMRGS